MCTILFNICYCLLSFRWELLLHRVVLLAKLQYRYCLRHRKGHLDILKSNGPNAELRGTPVRSLSVLNFWIFVHSCLLQKRFFKSFKETISIQLCNKKIVIYYIKSFMISMSTVAEKLLLSCTFFQFFISTLATA